tara:strand:+ start:1067 stop:1591 length:525 start_codon:yes stop_codon:yes gene_type:complete
MANQRLTDKSALANNTGTGDLFMVVDISDTTGSAAGTSKKVDSQYIIQTDILSVNLDLNTTPKTIVSAAGSGKIIQPLTITFIYTHVGIASSVANYLYVSYDSSSTSDYLVKQRDFIKDDNDDRTYIFGGGDATASGGTYEGSIDNRPLIVHTSADLGGNGTIKCIVTYQIVVL